MLKRLKYLQHYFTFIHNKANTMTIKIAPVTSTPRRISSTNSTSASKRSKAPIYSKCKIDTHADISVAGANFVVLEYTGKECDVSPYRDDYTPIHNVPIVHAATAWQSHQTGQTYILVVNEALWMGDTLKDTLLNPNQLRHYGTTVQNNPVSDSPLCMIGEGKRFSMELHMSGPIVYFDSHSPSEEELRNCPHITLSSPHPWDPTSVTFPKSSRSLEEEVGGLRHVSAVSTLSESVVDSEVNASIFDLSRVTQKISAMKSLEDVHTHLQRNEK